MQPIKKAIRKVLSVGGDLYYWGRYKQICLSNAGRKPLLIVDIDNTIADTLKYEQANPGKKIAISQLEPLVKTRTWLNEQAATHTIVYLTARNYWQHRRTIQWLQEHHFPFTRKHIVLVTTPKHKLRYLQFSCLHHQNVTYLDDLSYLDRNGTVRLYDDVIAQVRKLPLHYLDLAFIQGL